jgi:hypothetical protein
MLKELVRFHVVRPTGVGGPVRICGFRMFCNVADVSFLHAVGEGVEMEGRSFLENTNSGTITKYNSMYTAHLCLKSTGEGSVCCCYLCSLFTSRFYNAVLSKAYVYYRQKYQSRPQQYIPYSTVHTVTLHTLTG